MFEGPTIIWAASRTASAAERRILSQTARTAGAEVRITLMSSLASEVLSSIVRGAVVVIVDSRKDAAAALGLGADQALRVTPGIALRKRTLQGAVERAAIRSRARVGPVFDSKPSGEYPGLALLMRVIEQQLGTSIDQTALKCRELADELTRTVAAADSLMQRVSRGSALEERKGLSKDVKEYALATLKTETLVSELQEQVERGDAVMRLLGDPLAGRSEVETDAESLLRQLSEFLRSELGDNITLDVATSGPCFVPIGRPTVLCILCAAVENALESIRAAGARGRLQLRASRTDEEILIEVADDGVPCFTDLRASVVDSLLADPRRTKLRQLRERVRALGGELTVDTDEAGTLLSIYLPMGVELMPADPVTQIPKLRRERQNQ
jgi:hypothetical protein